MPSRITSTALVKTVAVREAQARKPCLLFVSGMDAGRLLPIEVAQGSLVIGRDDAADVTLDGPEISRQHARLDVDGTRLVLVDLDSKNGTFVNGEQIERAELKADDKLRIGPYFVLKLTFQDEEEIAFARQLYNRAVSDPLTGIVNRQFFSSTLEREWAFAARHGQPISLALLDLDHFKAINDTYGHMTGDEVLRECVQRLQRTTRLEDLIGRYGGEEFIVLLRDTEERGALVVAERVRRAIAERRFVAQGHSIAVTVSVGVACFGPERIVASRPDELVREADERLYAAKGGGRNRVVAGPQAGSSESSASPASDEP
jgi:two-component system, cell cycle response regulator